MATAKKQAAKRATTKKAASTRVAAPKLGRPPKHGVSRTDRLSIRLSPAERTELDAAATKHAMPVTELILEAVRAFRRR